MDLEAGEHGLVLWTDVGAAAEGGNRHRVPVQDRQVVAVATVWNIVSALAMRNNVSDVDQDFSGTLLNSDPDVISLPLRCKL